MTLMLHAVQLILSKQELLELLENCITHKYAQIRTLKRDYATLYLPTTDALRWILYKAVVKTMRGRQV